MGKIKIKFYLKNSGVAKTEVDVTEFCDVNEKGVYVYKMVIDGQEKDVEFTSTDAFVEVLQAGIQDTLDRYYEAKLNGGTITNEKVDTVLTFGDITVPIESIAAIKTSAIHEIEFSEENTVEVEECD